MVWSDSEWRSTTTKDGRELVVYPAHGLWAATLGGDQVLVGPRHLFESREAAKAACENAARSHAGIGATSNAQHDSRTHRLEEDPDAR